MTGAELRQGLAQQKLTQAAFAAYVGVNTRTVRRWCSGKSRVPWYAEYIMTALRGAKIEGPDYSFRVAQQLRLASSS